LFVTPAKQILPGADVIRRAALILTIFGLTTVSQAQTADSTDVAKTLVARLDLERYKTTLKGLTQFGDRRQGTDRNRNAVDWIEAQLKSYGCTNTERIVYDYQPPGPRPAGSPAPTRPAPGFGSGGARMRGVIGATGVNTDSLKQPDARL